MTTVNTGGWDAVCAINAANLNELFLHWFLTSSPTGPTVPMHMWFPLDDTNGLIVDVELGSPEVSIPVDCAQQVMNISMIIASGTLMYCDARAGVVHNVLNMQPDTARVTGTVNLTKVYGELVLGETQLQLAAGTYQADISGLDPNSNAGSSLGPAIEDFLAANNVLLPIGGVGTSSVPNCLQPTFFEFWVQPNPCVPGDGCVLLLIKTNGGLGTFGSLPAYPIPDGSSAALIVSNQVLFNQLFPAQLSASMANAGLPLSFSGAQRSDGTYQSSIADSSMDLGVVTYSSIIGQPASSTGQTDQYGDYVASSVTVPFDGLSLSPSGGQLSLAFDHSWDQGRCWMESLGANPPVSLYDATNTHLWYTAAASPNVAKCVVTFPLSGTPQCKSAMDDTLDTLFGHVDPASQVQSQITQSVTPFFEDLQVGDVDTFALLNILFYNHTLDLPDAAVPGDLVLTGSVVAPLMLQPSIVPVSPGGAPVQFSATANGDTPAGLNWSLIPANLSGSIDPNGKYTPPASIARPMVVTVQAAQGDYQGRALVLLYQAQPTNPLTVAPPAVTLTAGQTFDFAVADGQGDSVAVEWTLEPPSPSGGSMSESNGTWTYTAPAEVADKTKVALAATSTTNAAECGVATVTLVPQATVTITPHDQTVSPGQSANLSASAAGLSQLSWAVWPTSAGTFTPSPDSFSGTFSPADGQQVGWILAYGGVPTGEQVGVGDAWIKISQS